MKKLLALSFFLAAPVFAQSATPIYYADPTDRTCLEGRNCSPLVDIRGRLIMTVSTGPTDLGKAEDSAAASGDTGVMSLAVANENFTLLSGSALDYTPISVGRTGTVFVMADFRAYQSATDTANGILKKEDDAHASADVGVASLVRRIDTLATSAGTTGDYAVINQNVNGALYVQEVGGPANGGSLYNKISTANNNSTNIKNSAAQVYSVAACNINAAVRWLKIYNSASAPTCGTDTPVMRFAIPVNNCINATFPTGAGLGSGLGICIVTGATDADNTATAANEQTVQITYK